MRVAIGLAVLSILGLTACQPQEIDYDRLGASVATAVSESSDTQIEFFGSGARLIELEKGEFNVYAVAVRADSFDPSFFSQEEPELSVIIKPVGGIWTEIMSLRSEGEEEVLVGTGNLKIDDPGLYILHGVGNEAVWGLTVNIVRR